MKIAIIGASGQLGNDVVRQFCEHGDEVCPLRHEDIEIGNADSVRNVLAPMQPDVVVNTAAMHNVETCEQQPEEAFAANCLGPRNLAAMTRELDAVLVHVSTDYVFDGKKSTPYNENDVPCPLNVYGNTKLAGEHFVRSTTEKHFVVRTSGLYGKNLCRGKRGLNFVELMLKLARERGEVRVVHDEIVSPTSTEELARQIFVLSRSRDYGLYHATAEGFCSWYEFAREIFEMTNTPVVQKVASSNEFPAKVARPQYSVLENRALKLRGLNIFRQWQDGLRDYLEAARLSATEVAS